VPGKARQLAAEPVRRDLARPPPSHTWRGPGHILPDGGNFAGSDTPEFVGPPSVLNGPEAEPIPAIPVPGGPEVRLPHRKRPALASPAGPELPPGPADPGIMMVTGNVPLP
jgi:hypothetical protein